MKVLFKLYNTYTRSVEEFTPLHANLVKMYTCGPTVYGDQHIGNYRTFIFEDVLVKTLRQLDYQVERVMNITDVGHLTSDEDEGEDKIEVGARRDGITAWDVAKKYEQRFLEDLIALNLERPEPLVRATDMIGEQIELIRQLEVKGYTYVTTDGVYFDTSKLPYYGELARLDIAGLQEGIRVESGEKKHKTDFALWKFSPTNTKRDMEWESPWGKGFPGWHIECSAIIRATLGETIDIHCGGVDHIPVHHTNEIAQSETATDKQLARFWCHTEFLLVDGGKMSKSLGNIYTISDLITKGYDPLAFRLFTYSANYRSKLNFTWEGLRAAQTSLHRLREYAEAATNEDHTKRVTEAYTSFLAALASDLNIPIAVAVIWDFLGSDATAEEKRTLLLLTDQILSLGLNRIGVSPEQTPLLVDLLARRQEARDTKNYELSDQLREDIAKEGFIVVDTPEGQKLQKKL